MSDLVGRIEATIKQKKLTFNRVERDCGLGNGTIKRWGEQSPRLDKLMLVSQYLDVSLDYLVFGILHSESSPNGDDQQDSAALKKAQGLTCDGSPLQDDEADLIAMFRLLPDYQQEDIFDLVYLKYKKHVERKKASIYSTYTRSRGGESQSGPGRGDEAADGTA